jgi:hypothetical protein
MKQTNDSFLRSWVDEESPDPAGTRPVAGLTNRVEARQPLTELERYTADHRALLDLLVHQAGIPDPVAFEGGSLHWPLMRSARKRGTLPVDGVLVRDWGCARQSGICSVLLGIQLYELHSIRFAQVAFPINRNLAPVGYSFLAVSRADYLRLYRIALRCQAEIDHPTPAPILPAEQLETLWQNTFGYLEQHNLRRIHTYGGRAHRGVLLTGAPGNGKTMACRWLWEECLRRRWEWRLVTPDDFRQARTNRCVEQLFSVQRRGILFFDDMDLALRDRDTVHETEDQSIFLTALDGIRVKEGVVYVFTTNCSLDLIDRAFKRPGRIDVALQLKPPDADLRRQLVQGWHEDIRAHLDLEAVVASTEGHSFAEIEELKNLLIMRFMEAEVWDWGWVLEQFRVNREDLAHRQTRVTGFQTPSDER